MSISYRMDEVSFQAKDGSLVKGHLEEFKHGQLTAEYEGELKNDQFHGQGVLSFPLGNRIEGKWNNGRLNGKGKVTFADGGTVEGSFVSGRCGDGVYKDKSGKTVRTNVSYSTVD